MPKLRCLAWKLWENLTDVYTQETLKNEDNKHPEPRCPKFPPISLCNAPPPSFPSPPHQAAMGTLFCYQRTLCIFWNFPFVWTHRIYIFVCVSPLALTMIMLKWISVVTWTGVLLLLSRCHSTDMPQLGYNTNVLVNIWIISTLRHYVHSHTHTHTTKSSINHHHHHHHHCFHDMSVGLVLYTCESPKTSYSVHFYTGSAI